MKDRHRQRDRRVLWLVVAALGTTLASALSALGSGGITPNVQPGVTPLPRRDDYRP